jgi:hypothetical protein
VGEKEVRGEETPERVHRHRLHLLFFFEGLRNLTPDPQFAELLNSSHRSKKTMSLTGFIIGVNL